ncbi:MAG: HlyD family efflux transporter periplasmic adaptor subunit [Rhodoferax sp.]|nr:HlyD family efflux transporter periplasmic adaptor subunit [Rhodoferax sp.]
MKNKLVFGALMALFLAGLVWAFWPRAPEVELARVTRGRFERAVQEDGQTRVQARYAVSTPVAGRLARILLVRGDQVLRGDAVATISPMAPALLDARSQTEQRARVGAAQAAWAQAQAQVGAATAALAQSQQDVLRNAALVQQGFVSTAQSESLRLAAQLRDSELLAAQQAQQAARFALDQARAPLQANRPSRAGTGGHGDITVRSPVAGTVLQVLLQSEGVVQAGAALVDIGDPDRLEVVVDILTEEAAQVQSGTAVELMHWGGTGTLQGKVRYVEPAAFTKVSALGVQEQRVNVVVDITSPAAVWKGLGDGFKVDVRLLVQVEHNAVMVPVSALFPVGARSAVFVWEAGRVRLHELTVAARNGVEAWVQDDLPVGTQVVLYPAIILRDGARATARQ